MQALMEPETEIWKEIEHDLREYPRMTADIARITAELEHVGGNLTARIDGMPRTKSGRSDPTGREVVRRERKWRQLQRMQEKVDRLDRAADAITDVRQMILLDLLMDGTPHRQICTHMKLSRSYIWEIRQELIYNLTRAAQDE